MMAFLDAESFHEVSALLTPATEAFELITVPFSGKNTATLEADVGNKYASFRIIGIEGIEQK